MANNTILLSTTNAGGEVVCPKSSQSSSLSRSSTSNKNVNWTNTAKHLLAGGLSGCTEVSLTYPTDYVKIMLQLQDKSGEKRKFKNSFDVVRQTIRTHGVLGLYRGFSVVFYGAIPKYMFRFGSYQQIKQFIGKSNEQQLRPQEKLICGLGAGILEALFAVIPQESIKVKFINDRCSDHPRYRGLIHGIKEIIHEKGLRGIYQGVAPTLLKSGSNQAIRFLVFDSLKEWFNGKSPENKSSTKFMMPIFGATAGAASVLCNTPFDVVKTRMQGLEAHRFTSSIDCVIKIYKNEGVLAFYKGLGPRLVKVSLEVAIAFTVYNTLVDIFFDKNNQKQ